MVVSGLVFAMVTSLVSARGGVWVLVGAGCVLATIACEWGYVAVSDRVGELGRRALVFVPLSNRIAEVAWLYGFWRLGVPAGVVVAAGAVSFTHEYVRSRAYIAGLRGSGMLTLGEHSGRGWAALAGYGIAGAVAVTGAPMAEGLGTGLMSIAATAWLLLGVLGLIQLTIVVSAALRK
ncbi:CDP-diacylglycerol--glycerol-3-phosphate 3-phosphatidyltransferase [Stackebrandtia soli]